MEMMREPEQRRWCHDLEQDSQILMKNPFRSCLDQLQSSQIDWPPLSLSPLPLPSLSSFSPPPLSLSVPPISPTSSAGNRVLERRNSVRHQNEGLCSKKGEERGAGMGRGRAIGGSPFWSEAASTAISSLLASPPAPVGPSHR
jgi:hypothetical protein